jgi:alkanesulfonate monooxygenase SsuD/methylene tetrahydromethanopterin reductase-like flavin-dependent oxidoreductase (luciferase family)
MMARLRTGEPLGPLDLVEDAEKVDLTPQQQHIVDRGLGRAVLGTPVEAAEQVRTLAERFDVDEVMVHPVVSRSPRHRPGHRARPRAHVRAAGQGAVLKGPPRAEREHIAKILAEFRNSFTLGALASAR